jgi:GNAT superfamily N-acetyltransferase
MDQIQLRRPMIEETEKLNYFFKLVLEHTFESNGICDLVDSLNEEIHDKRKCLKEDFESEGQRRFFLVAVWDDTIIGSIAYGPSNETIVDCSLGMLKDTLEIGTVFVHPDYQKQGVLNLLLKGIFHALALKGVSHFCFDSGYPIAQKIWTKKFGPPLYHLKDYWAEGADHMVWYIALNTTIKF